jgi:hypothetical protein
VSVSGHPEAGDAVEGVEPGDGLSAAHAVCAAWYAALDVSMELGVDPEVPLGSVTPCSFRQFR